MTWTPGNWPHDGEPTVLVPMDEPHWVEDDSEPEHASFERTGKVKIRMKHKHEQPRSEN